MLPEPLPWICSEVGLQDSIQAFGVVQQDLVLRDIIRFDSKRFVVVEGIPTGFEENAAAAWEQWARRSLAQIESGAGDVDALLPKIRMEALDARAYADRSPYRPRHLSGGHR